MITDSCDVIVIGAGPVGATAALLLASHGLTCTVIEARREPQPPSCARTIDAVDGDLARDRSGARHPRPQPPMHELRCIP